MGSIFLVVIQCQKIWAFDLTENKHSLYRGKDCMKKFSESLREQVKNIVDFEKKKMFPPTKEELNFIKPQNYVIFVERETEKISLKVQIIGS